MSWRRPPTPPSVPPGERMVSTGDFNVSGDLSTRAFLGAQVHNDDKETVGRIEDIYLDKDGAIKTVMCRSAASSASAPDPSR